MFRTAWEITYGGMNLVLKKVKFMMTLTEFREARDLLSGILSNTSLIHSPYYSKRTGGEVYIKPENMQVTGAYKVRGACYKVSTLTEEEKAKGLVTASAGNHAQGVAFAAQRAGIEATIVMPTTTPLVKVNNTKDYGAHVVLEGSCFDESAAVALKLSEEKGLTYIHPFNDLTVATGQGTIAYEIFKDLPDVDIILMPIGGGGLASGVSTLTKLLNPNVKVIGVEPVGRRIHEGGAGGRSPGDAAYRFYHCRRCGSKDRRR